MPANFAKTLTAVFLVIAVGFAIGYWLAQRRPTTLTPTPSPTVTTMKLPPPTPVPTPQIVIDSRRTRDEALQGKEFPEEIRQRLTLLEIEYSGFDGRLHRGQLIVDESLAEEVKQIFAELRQAEFPIEKMLPVARYDWSDEASMADNNSSGFNYRRVEGQRRLSLHAQGRAIDINPMQNPFIRSGRTSPAGALYQEQAPGTVSADGIVVRAFKARGWEWGGDWNSMKDYQHFQKPR